MQCWSWWWPWLSFDVDVVPFVHQGGLSSWPGQQQFLVPSWQQVPGIAPQQQVQRHIVTDMMPSQTLREPWHSTLVVDNMDSTIVSIGLFCGLQFIQGGLVWWSLWGFDKLLSVRFFFNHWGYDKLISVGFWIVLIFNWWGFVTGIDHFELVSGNLGLLNFQSNQTLIKLGIKFIRIEVTASRFRFKHSVYLMTQMYHSNAVINILI